jgi:hypothetical protein
MAWAISAAVFITLFLALTHFCDASDAFVVAIIGVLCLFIYLNTRAVGIQCPHCKKYISTNTPWICGNKDTPHRNDRFKDFPFIHQCQHCGFIPKAYECHHCFKLIFLSEDQQQTAYAKCADLPDRAPTPRPVEKDPYEGEISKKKKEVELTELNLKKAKFDVELKGYKETLEPPKPKTQREITEESFSNFEDRNMSGAEIVRRKRAEVAEKFKDNPPELERQNRLIDQWARDHLDLM